MKRREMPVIAAAVLLGWVGNAIASTWKFWAFPVSLGMLLGMYLLHEFLIRRGDGDGQP